MQLDNNGDSEGNFSVLALQPYNLTDNNFSCTHHMLPVGYFHKQDNQLEYKLLTPNAKIDWPGGYKPEDEPSCGFNNESCPKNDTHFKSIVSAGVLAVMLFCAGVITVSIYRKWKIEQEIEGLLWKIDPDEIHHYFGNDIVSSPSKVCTDGRSGLKWIYLWNIPVEILWSSVLNGWLLFVNFWRFIFIKINRIYKKNYKIYL